MLVGLPFGRYRLLRKIGAGGMAEVFLAKLVAEAGFEKEVVVKRLFSNLAARSDVLRMFRDEARIAARFDHPHVAQVYDLGRIGDDWYIAMEYVRGKSLVDVCRRGIERSDFVPLGHVLRIVAHLAEGLHHAHTRTDEHGHALGIVHRDVTPSNVLVSFDGIVKILDFGIARTLGRAHTDPGVLKGTMAYMSPEAIRGEVVDRRADVFSAGVILYELTTGVRLFRGDDFQIMRRIVEQDAPAPSSVSPGYPPLLERIVLRALSRDRDERYPDAAALAGELEDALVSLGLRSTPLAIAGYLERLFPSESRDGRREEEIFELSARPGLRVSNASLLVIEPPPPDGPAAQDAGSPPLDLLAEDAPLDLDPPAPPTRTEPFAPAHDPDEQGDFLRRLERRIEGADTPDAAPGDGKRGE